MYELLLDLQGVDELDDELEGIVQMRLRICSSRVTKRDRRCKKLFGPKTMGQVIC